MVSNPNFYGASTTGTPSQLKDGVDFPHTGLIKALSDGLGQNYAISGFDITFDSATQIDVGAGVIIRDGKRIPVAGVDNLTLINTYTNGFHLLVANNHATAPVLEIINPTAVNEVPQYRNSQSSPSAGADTIIAVITHDGNNPMPVQYLTVHKTENSLSIGHDSSGYTESGNITGDANSIDIVSTPTDADINITPNGTGKTVIKNMVATGLTDADGDTKIQVEESADEDIIRFDTAGSERMIITETGLVGINQATPTHALDIKASGSEGIRLYRTNHGEVEINIDSQNSDARVSFSDAGTDKWCLGKYDTDSSFRISQDGVLGTDDAIIVDSSRNVGIGNVAPAAKLDVTGNIISSGTISGDVVDTTISLNNAGSRKIGVQLNADSSISASGITEHMYGKPSDALTNANVLTLGKEHHLIGLDSSATNSASHQAAGNFLESNPLTYVGSGAMSDTTGTNIELITKGAQTILAGGSHTYTNQEVFGGHAGFIALPDATNHQSQKVTLTNITSFGLYILVSDSSNGALRAKINGGLSPMSSPYRVYGNRGVDMTKILMYAGGSPTYVCAGQGQVQWDAYLLKPRESVTFASYAIGSDSSNTYQAFLEQGLSWEAGKGHWFVHSTSSPSSGMAAIQSVSGGTVHVPVHLTGTSFMCGASTTIVLPPTPPIGTQYAFLSIGGTQTVQCSAGHIADNEFAAFTSTADELFELSTTALGITTSIAAGEGRTFVYVDTGMWQVIG